jgi:hypothetical protein
LVERWGELLAAWRLGIISIHHSCKNIWRCTCMHGAGCRVNFYSFYLLAGTQVMEGERPGYSTNLGWHAVVTPSPELISYSIIRLDISLALSLSLLECGQYIYLLVGHAYQRNMTTYQGDRED